MTHGLDRERRALLMPYAATDWTERNLVMGQTDPFIAVLGGLARARYGRFLPSAGR